MSLVGFKSSNHPQQVGKRGATDRDNLGTDPELFGMLNRRFGFTLDPACTYENRKCATYYTKDVDGLAQPWRFHRVWCNPPYSEIRRWVEKALLEWAQFEPPELIVMLLPANRTEQRWWQDLVEPRRDREGSALRVEFLRGRQRFVMPGAESIGPNERPPFGCCLLIWQSPARASQESPE